MSRSLRASIVGLLGSVLCALLVVGCTTPPTEVITILDTNVPDTRLMTIATRTSRGTTGGDGGAIHSWIRHRGSVGSIELPASFAIVPGTDQPHDSAVTLEIEVHVSPGEMGEPGLNFRRTARFRFVPGRPEALRIFLNAGCGALTTGCTHPGADGCTLSQLCDERGETCNDEGQCASPDSTLVGLDAAVLPRADVVDATSDVGDVRPSDANTDANPDAGCASCPTRPHATTTCVGSMCGFTCDTGFADCDTNPSNGCEVDTRVDTQQCGMCGHACPTAPNMMTSCAGGTCNSMCAAGFADCDTDTTNGCESTVASDAMNCGRCGNACATGLAHATTSCVTGACVTMCNPGYADCDGMPANGCEASLSDPTNCGGCGNVCPVANPICGMSSTGGMMCVSGCSGSQVRCGSTCADLQSDATHCGSCTTACTGGQTCQMGTCACPMGQTLCSGVCRNLQTDASHCGSCTRSCGAASCSGGRCICGATGQPCCSGSTCNAGNVCSGGSCVACGGVGQPCCGGSACNPGGVCRSNTCQVCGRGGQLCCGGNTCSEGNCVAAFGDYFCACGGRGQACCSGGACNEGACRNVFGSDICVCGGNGDPCCAGGGCDSPLCCGIFGTCGCCGLEQGCGASTDCCDYPSVFCCSGYDGIFRCSTPGEYPGC